MKKRHLCLLITCLAVIMVTVPPAIRATSKITRQPTPSPELRVVIKLLREGAQADAEPDFPPDIYASSIWWDITADPATLPAGHGRFVSVFNKNVVELGPLNCDELWRVWCDLMGILGSNPSVPITCSYGPEEYSLLFSRRFSKVERVRCVDRIVPRLIERCGDHQHYLHRLPIPPSET